jgi:hypothetical protein
MCLCFTSSVVCCQVYAEDMSGTLIISYQLEALRIIFLVYLTTLYSNLDYTVSNEVMISE